MMIDVPPEPLLTQEQIIEQRLLDCGLNSGGFTVKYEDYLQSIEIAIAPSAGATSDNFACIKEAAGYEIVTFQDGAMFAAYMDFVSQLARPEMMAMFEGRLKEAGLWEGFPDRENFVSLEEYAKALEVHAGNTAGSALRVSADGIVFDPPSASQNYAAFAERYSNLISVVAYASTKDRVKFGLIGNERVRE
jgi:hypothetical protein